MKEVFRTTSLEEAQIFCTLLREHEIEPLLDGEYSGPVTLGLYTTATPLIVHVPDEHEAAAREILDALARERKGEVVFEADPGSEAAAPAEEARFREDLARARASQRRRWLFVGLFLVPTPLLLLLALALLLSGRYETAWSVFVSAVAYIVMPLAIHFMARPARVKSPT